ncbi:hypothetical protein CAPN008_21970 [Capnocytophaga canis]|uniref:UbiA family prenyltransferase n=1 Tax=Capnocytophaga TaxID=1016 RepID=UPI0012FFAF82|nr:MULTISPECIES: UbiA family prenyltransferase [Capnocytophaga]GIM62147.1 hypothetical protein CAPN008_21970 [Capnocytophaga canis]
MAPFNQLRGFFSKNMENQSENQQKTPILETGEIEFGKTELQTYEDWGFDMSKKQKGNERAFMGCWVLVREYYSKRERTDTEKKEEDVKKAQNELDRLEVSVKQKEQVIENIRNKNESIKDKIDGIRKDIFRINENPESVLKEKSSMASFIIGLVILLGLTVYLFVFYSSAAYSALFKDFTPDDDKVAAAIFDSQALVKAYELGGQALLFVLAIPFAFLGLGFLIHKFQETKGVEKYLKIGFLIVITFIFDAILAYEIVEKIYEIKRLADMTGSMPIFSPSLAFEQVNFWVIIFAGFVVYLIWGFVFDFTMESYDKLNVVNQAIKTRESEIKLLEDDIQKNQKEIEANQECIQQLELEMVPHRKIVGGDVFVMNWSRFYQCVNEFTNGWTEWMTANRFEKHFIDEIHLLNEKLSNEHKGNIVKS